MKHLIAILLLCFSSHVFSFGNCPHNMDTLKDVAIKLSEHETNIFNHPVYTVFTTDWPYAENIYALYNDKMDVLMINEPLLFKVPESEACAVLVHEMVHVLQNRLKYMSLTDYKAREIEAYNVQNLYLYGEGAGTNKTEKGVQAVVRFKNIERHIANASTEKNLLNIQCHQKGYICKNEVSKGSSWLKFKGIYFYPIYTTIKLKIRKLFE